MSPSRAAATAWPPSWPGRPAHSTASTSSSHGISTGVAAFTTTTVRRAAAATALDQRVLPAGQAQRRLVDGLRLLLLGEADDHHGDLGRRGGGDRVGDRLVVGSRGGDAGDQADAVPIAAPSASDVASRRQPQSVGLQQTAPSITS